MAQLPVSDNTALNAPKELDDRKGVFSAGVWRAFLNEAEANAKTLNRRPINMEVPITTEVSTGVFEDLMYRWNGSEWIISDAIYLVEESVPTSISSSIITV